MSGGGGGEGGGGRREMEKEDGTRVYRKPKGSERSSHRQTARTRKQPNLSLHAQVLKKRRKKD